MCKAWYTMQLIQDVVDILCLQVAQKMVLFLLVYN